MITIAICDDERYFLEALQKKVEQFITKRGIDSNIAVFNCGEELLNAQSYFDIILMDMKLPGLSGIEVIEKLRKNSIKSNVIFISSFQELAIKAFDLEAVHYLLKPITDEKLDFALDKALKKVVNYIESTIAILKGNVLYRVKISEIVFCESMDHKIYIRTLNANFDYFGTLDALYKKLDNRFYRCHRSYIVNLNFVISKEKDIAIVAGGSTVLISRRKQQEFTQKLLAFFKNEVL